MSNSSKDINDELQGEYKDAKSDLIGELDSRILWVLVPMIIGGIISMFSNVQQDIQIIIWAVMFMIAAFGLWAHSAKMLRKKREKLESKRWDRLDSRFDNIDTRFDEINKRFDLAENTDRTLLRNELVKFHREWVEHKGYITLEALEYVDKVHEAYNKVYGNDTGDQIWRDLHNLPIRENRIKPAKTE